MVDITLIFPNSPFLLDSKVFPPLGILYLSASLKNEGYSVECFDFSLNHSPFQVQSQYVGISFTTPQRDQAYSLAKMYKNEGKTTIAGGAHATHMSKECLQNGFDYVIKGEADIALPKFLKYRESAPVDLDFPIITAVEPTNLNRVLFPDRDALPIKDYHYEIDGKKATVIMTSRGCPSNPACSFCSRITERFRMQSAERTVFEILEINNRYGFEAFMIFDDVFAVGKKRLFEIAQMLAARKFVFRCFGKSSLLTREICELLKKLGVVEVGIGIESGSNSILAKNIKGTTRDMNIQAVKNLKEFGIRTKAFLIVGLPGETEETIAETENWIKEAEPFDVDMSIFQPMPGSAIFKDPTTFGISFNYNGKPCWYKGTPGTYESSVIQGSLSPDRLVMLRDELEQKYKRPELLR